MHVVGSIVIGDACLQFSALEKLDRYTEAIQSSYDFKLWWH